MKKIKNLAIFMLILLLSNSKVYATTLTAIKDNAWSTGEVMKVEDGVETTTHLRKLLIDNNSPAYCVDYGAHIKTGDVSVNQIDLISYFSRGISEQAAQDLNKKLGEYLYFGYGSEGRTSEKYFFATQKLVWETINATGFYKSQDYTSRVGTTNFSTVGYKIKNGNNIDISAELAAINKSISDYYIKPSMCTNNNKLELAVEESKIFTDSNGVLSKYSIECGDGLSCNVNGNNLTVTAVAAGKDRTITFVKRADGLEPILYENPTPDPDSPEKENQNVIIGGYVGPVSCSFNIDTFQNVQTGNILKATIIILGITLAIVASAISLKILFSNKNTNIS